MALPVVTVEAIPARRRNSRAMLLAYLFAQAHTAPYALPQGWRFMRYLPVIAPHRPRRWNNLLAQNVAPITVTVPNVVGIQQSLASSVLASSGLTTGTITPQTSPLPIGQVLSQSPIAGSTVSSGSSVSLVVSAGGPYVLLNDAITRATQAGLNVIRPVMWAASSTVPYGYVIAQNPAAGTIVPLGLNTYLTASNGPAPPPGPLPNIPNVLGMARFDAEKLIEDNGCNVNPVYVFANSNTYAQGLVMAQTPGPQSPVTAGTVVTLTISLGIAITYYGSGGVTVPLMH